MHWNPGILESNVKVCLVILLRVLVVRLGEERTGGEERAGVGSGVGGERRDSRKEGG